MATNGLIYSIFRIILCTFCAEDFTEANDDQLVSDHSMAKEEGRGAEDFTEVDDGQLVSGHQNVLTTYCSTSINLYRD